MSKEDWVRDHIRERDNRAADAPPRSMGNLIQQWRALRYDSSGRGFHYEPAADEIVARVEKVLRVARAVPPGSTPEVLLLASWVLRLLNGEE